MNYQNLLLTLEGGILTIAINRPKALNALDQQTFSELRAVFAEVIPQTEGLKGVIVTGAGEKAFVAGADITEFSALDQAAAAQLSSSGQAVFALIERCAKPVVAAINGFALGGGCELAMACHLRVASENARLGQPEVNLGIVPGYGATQRLTALIGRSKALELLLTADMITAQEANRLGLVNKVVAVGEAVAESKVLIEKIAAKAPMAVAKIIELVNVHFEPLETGFVAESNAFGECATTADFKEGVKAFLEKRKPLFEGK